MKKNTGGSMTTILDCGGMIRNIASLSSAACVSIAAMAQFHWVHAMAVDAKGNVYTAEVDNAKRIQKFRLMSDALR
jgi:hypothetical protein